MLSSSPASRVRHTVLPPSTFINNLPTSILCALPLSVAVLDRAQQHPDSHLGNHGPRRQAAGSQVSLFSFSGAHSHSASVWRGVWFASLAAVRRKVEMYSCYSHGSKSYPHNKGNSFSLPARRMICLFMERQAR